MAYFSSPLPRLRWHYLSPGDRGRIWPIQGLIYTESPRNVHFKMFRYWTTKVEWLFYMKHIQIHVTHFFFGGGVPQGGKTSSFFLIRSFWRWKKNVFLHVIVGAHGELLVQSSVNVTGLLIAPYWTCISPYIGPKKYRSKEWHSICWTHTHTDAQSLLHYPIFSGSLHLSLTFGCVHHTFSPTNLPGSVSVTRFSTRPYSVVSLSPSLSLSALLLPFNLRQSTSAHFNPALIITKRKTNSLSRALQLILKQLLLFFIQYLQCKRCAQWRCEEWKHTFSFAPVWLSSSPSLSLSFKSICTLRGEWKLNGSNSILSWSP